MGKVICLTLTCALCIWKDSMESSAHPPPSFLLLVCVAVGLAYVS